MRRFFSTVVMVALIALAAPVAAQDETAGPAPDVEVTQAVVATGVQDREPVGPDTTFTADVGTLYFYTIFEGDFGAMPVEHVWLHEGEEIARVALTVEGPRWRTWSSKEVLPDWTGDWTVRVVDADGVEHAAVDFTVTAGM